MNRDIAQYVLTLGNRVTRRQHHVLLVLACHHQNARETYWPSREKLAAELSMDESQLRRIINGLEAEGIIRQTAGNGSGNHSGYVFLELEKGDKKGDKKGDFFDPAIRNYKIFTKTQDQVSGGESISTSPLPGKFTQKDFDERDLRLMGMANRKLLELNAHFSATEDLYAWLSLQSGLSPARLRQLERQIGFNPPEMGKPPQSEIA